MDIILSLRRKHFLFKKCYAVSLQRPLDVPTKDGQFREPPSSLWGGTSSYAIDRVDIPGLTGWFGTCLGESIVEAIKNRILGAGEALRLLVTADTDARSRELLFTMPWEILENVDDFVKAGLLANVVRVIDASREQESDPPIERLKVAVTWANPHDDIPELQDHIAELTALGKKRDDLVQFLEPIEFTSLDAVRDALAEERPDVLYHIGHATQPSQANVRLHIGASANPTYCDQVAFRKLLHEIRTRVLLLNSCAATVGMESNPYLGVAGFCGEEIEAVISMQTMVPVVAAKAFAEAFFCSLAEDQGLARSVWRGRLAIARCMGKTIPFSRFIPVLLQHTLQDRPVRVDLDGRERKILLKSLEANLHRIDTYLWRRHDDRLKRLLLEPEHRVNVVYGDNGSGKTTSLGKLLIPLLDEHRYRKGERWLYHDYATSTKPGQSTTDEEGADRQLLDLLLSFDFPQTNQLTRQLKKRRISDDDSALNVLATWFGEEDQLGRSYYLCVDNLPSDLATKLAVAAQSRVTSAGRLLIVTPNAELPTDLPVGQLEMGIMDDEELAAALQDHNLNFSGPEVSRLAQASARIPLLVAAYVKGGVPAKVFENPVDTFLSRRPLSADEQQILCFAAHCETPIPKCILTQHFGAQQIELLTEEHLLLRSDGDRYQLPDMLRPHFRKVATNLIDIHKWACDGFDGLACKEQYSYSRVVISQVNGWFHEAFHHAIKWLTCIDATDPAVDAWLDESRETAKVLHQRLVIQRGEVAPMKAVWEQYLEAASTRGRFSDREAEYHYAGVLLRMGRFADAESFLQSVTAAEEEDELQLRALHMHANLLKTRGAAADFDQRIELLATAVALGEKLGREEIKAELAELELSLGNARSYGKHARPKVALVHFRRARDLFEQLNDVPNLCRAKGEEIGMRRYNEMLEDEKLRADAINTLQENLRDLVVSGANNAIVDHLYELGRLETDLVQKADWFRRAAMQAGETRQPINLHAAINWRCAEVRAELKDFQDVAAEVQRLAHVLLEKWSGHSWSRRVARGAFEFLGEGYERNERWEEALTAWQACCRATQLIREHRESRKDPERRLRIARRCGRLAVQLNHWEAAREATTVAADLCGLDVAGIPGMRDEDIRQFFDSDGK